MDITDESLYLLLEAVIKQAADDYRKALRKEEFYNIRELRKFFRSGFCEEATGASGEYILEQLDKEYIKEIGNDGILQQIREDEANRNKKKH